MASRADRAGCLVAAVLHLGEVEHFAALMPQVRPAWLLAAIALQVATHVCAAAA